MNEETETVGADPSVATSTRRKWIKKVQAVEPVVFLTMISSSIFISIQTNTVELQYCKSVLGIDNSTLCLNNTLPNFEDIQKFTSQFSMIQSFFDSFIPVTGALFLGPWSDTFGRVPLMLSGNIGYFLTLCLWMWGSITKLHPYYFLSFGLPLSISGGQMIPLMAMFCYVCDITTLSERALRLGIMQGVLYIGVLVGTLLSPQLIKISYQSAFGVAACIEFVKFLYIVFVLKESVNASETERNSVGRNPFKFSAITSLYEACYVKQSHRVRKILGFIFLIHCFSLIQFMGESSIFYLFLQKVLGWTLIEYTPLVCFNIFNSAFSTFAGTWFLCKVLNLADIEIIALVSGTRMIGSLVLTYGRRIWLIYLAGVFTNTSAMYGTIVRVFLSKTVHSDDLGKIFSVLGAADSIGPVISTLFYNEVYRQTIDFFPSAVFLVSGMLCVFMTICAAKITHLYLRPSDDVQLTRTVLSINS